MESLTKHIGIQASVIQGVGEKWEQRNLAYSLPSHAMRQLLEQSIVQLIGKTGKNKKRLVVLVDDLDRCEAKTAYKLLEGIKIYLNLPSCIFVLGMNQQIIEGAIKQHLPAGENSDGLAQAYMEKLCQNIWHLPVLSEPEALLCELLATIGVQQNTLNTVQNIMAFSPCLPGNSRKIKRFANTLLQFLDRLPEEGTTRAGMQLMLIMASLYLFHHKLYRMLEVKPEFYNLIRQWAQGTKVDHQLFANLELTHKFGESDAREAVSEPSAEASDRYADPTDENVFRVQQLICDLGEVGTSEIRKYIIR